MWLGSAVLNACTSSADPRWNLEQPTCCIVLHKAASISARDTPLPCARLCISARHTRMLMQGATPLAVTVCCNHKPLTELLLVKGASPSPVVRLVSQSNFTHSNPPAL